MEYTWQTGGHIVTESFPYFPRLAEARCVVEHMKSRQTILSTEKSDDKSRNPLIAIPGSPGIGKSTFLCHFPESDAYKEYIGLSRSPIVSTLTFNKDMNYSPNSQDAPGLRVLYGAAVSMGVLCRKGITWRDFADRYPCHNLDVFTAVKILRHVFGSERPVLLLIDEISRAKNSVAVATSFGEVLDLIGDCDVVVSALSPGFVADLMSGSQRPIKYVVLAPLLQSDLG